MADLYKGIAGSPITYLTADISTNQTTISIADDSALPDAPNICTIGYGEELETIKYGVKSNGVLQEVVRGIEGTPRAWPAGTEVARFFTAYDHNAIIDDFIAHKAESANKHIKESGSNENGNYIKYDDGTMICFINSRQATTVGSGGQFSWAYPAIFTNKNVSIACHGNSTSQNYFFILLNASTVVSSAVMAARTATGGVAENTAIDVNIIAIGRWK
jgi:hypothetical protein